INRPVCHLNRLALFQERGIAMYRQITAAIVLLLTVTQAWAVTVSEATGKGAYRDSAGNVVSIQFKAGVDDQGNVFGSLQETTQISSKSNTSFHGTVTCYVLTSPTTAQFGGIIDSSTDPSQVGEFFVVSVVDDSPDEIGIAITKTMPDCVKVHVKLFDLIRG